MPTGSLPSDRRRRHRLTPAILGLVLLPLAAEAQTLRVRVGSDWHAVFDADRPPHQWRAPDVQLNNALHWQPARVAGVEYAEATLSGEGEAWRIRLIAVRIDPSRAVLRTVSTPPTRPGGASAQWTLRQAPASAVVALNAGQFDADGPWGWVVRNGVELQPPGRGPLAMALAIDGTGQPHLARASAFDALRRTADIRDGLQSWPYLLADDGTVPPALRDSTLGVRLRHRDARLAIGLRRDGRVLVTMTRFVGLGGLLEVVPFGLTVPEMAAIMGALDCRDAMLLDGGVSSQLLVRTAREGVKRWPGLRPVPLGLVVEARREGR